MCVFVTLKEIIPPLDIFVLYRLQNSQIYLKKTFHGQWIPPMNSYNLEFTYIHAV